MSDALWNHCVDEESEEASLLLDSSTSEEAAALVRYKNPEGSSCVTWLVEKSGPFELLVCMIRVGGERAAECNLH